MTLQEHLDTMMEFTRDSDDTFNGGGNTLAAAELLWGALAHGLIAVAEANSWRCEGLQLFAIICYSMILYDGI